MAKAGRKQKPLELKKLHKTLRKDRQDGKGVPATVIDFIPPAPSILNKYGKEEWNIIVPQLRELGLLAKTDMAMVKAYCINWGRYVALEHELSKGDRKFTTDKGNVIVHPMHYVQQDALKAAIKIATEFGFTPSSRAGIKVPKRKATDPLDELIAKSRASQ